MARASDGHGFSLKTTPTPHPSSASPCSLAPCPRPSFLRQPPPWDPHCLPESPLCPAPLTDCHAVNQTPAPLPPLLWDFPHPGHRRCHHRQAQRASPLSCPISLLWRPDLWTMQSLTCLPTIILCLPITPSPGAPPFPTPSITLPLGLSPLSRDSCCQFPRRHLHLETCPR